jgi:hypothetical protein
MEMVFPPRAILYEPPIYELNKKQQLPNLPLPHPAFLAGWLAEIFCP